MWGRIGPKQSSLYCKQDLGLNGDTYSFIIWCETEVSMKLHLSKNNLWKPKFSSCILATTECRTDLCPACLLECKVSCCFTPLYHCHTWNSSVCIWVSAQLELTTLTFLLSMHSLPVIMPLLISPGLGARTAVTHLSCSQMAYKGRWSSEASFILALNL